MAWTAQRTWTAGELVTAAYMNTYVRDDMNELRTGGIAMSGQGANEIPFASSSTQLSRSSSFLYDGTNLSVGTFGTHGFSAGGTGSNILRVRNSTAGTGNAGVLDVGNDADASLLQVLALSSTYTPANDLLANGISFRANGAGGLSLAAGHASGAIRFYAGGFTERANISTAGVLSVSGFGNHSFAAGGTGNNSLVVRNTTAGTGNYGYVSAGADGVLALSMLMFSSTWTTSGNQVQSGGSLETSGAGGLSIAATHASGVLRLYTGGTTERARIDAAGAVYIGDTANADITVGLTLNMGANAGTVLALKNSNVAHGLGTEETDTFASFEVISALGGLTITSYSEASSASTFRLMTQAASGSGDTTKGVTANGYIDILAFENGAAVGADENVLVVRSGNTTRFILDADGDSHQDVGTAWTNFDEFDDVALLTTISAGVSRKGDPLRRQFGALLKRNRRALEQARVVTFNADGHHFVNWSRLAMLKVGAIRQLAQQLAETRAELRRLQRQSRTV